MITANGMMTRIKANIAAVQQVQSSNPADALVQRDAVLLAMCQGIVDEIQQNATVTVTGVQPGGSTANGTVS